MTTSTSSGPTSGAHETLEHAQQSVGEVAGTAADEVRHVAREAGDEIRDLAGTLKEQVSEQSQAGLDRLVTTLSDLAEELGAMASGERPGTGMAGDLVREASTRTRGAAESIRGRAPGDLLHEVEDFARRRPGTFLLAAAVSGVLVGRMTKGALSAGSDREQHVDLREGGRPSGDQWGTGGPGSLGAEGLESGLASEAGSRRTGAGQGLAVEQDMGMEQDEPVIISALNHPTSADDMPGGTAEMPGIDGAIDESTYRRTARPGVQP